MKTTTRGILERSRTFIGRFTTGILLAFGIGQGVSAQIAPITGNFLNSWSLDGRPGGTNWASDFGYAPKSFTNILSVADTNVNVMLLDTNVAGHLQLNVEETDGTTNIFFPQGTIEFWFRPNWSSTNGPGTWGRLIEVGQSNSASGWWSIYVSPNGKTVNFSAQTNGLSTNYLSAQVTWASNVWHLIDLTYSDTNSALYVDGVVVTNGSGAVYWPAPTGLTNGFFVGSDLFGTNQAHGRFADLATFDYELYPTTIADDYDIAPPSDPTNAPTWAEELAINENSVLPWLHDGITNSDGSDATSFQNLMDSQINSFSSSGTFSWEGSARDAALSWATTYGLPTVIPLDGGLTAYLVDEEGNVPDYIAACDLTGAITISTTNVWPAGPTGFALTGTNTTISMWDEASPLLSHTELTPRATELDGNINLSDHSTAVAGILAGAGGPVYSNGIYVGPLGKGMGYQAQVQARDFFNDLVEMTGALGTNRMRLSNHSYELKGGWVQDATNAWYWLGYPQFGPQDPRFGNYTSNAANYDIVVQNSPTYLSVWAAGNERGFGPPVQPTNHYEFTLSAQEIRTNAVRALDGDQGGFDTLSQEAAAKDILTVGAINPLPSGFQNPTNVVLAFFSSCGPTDDGRIKPDVVADGVNNIVAIATGDFNYGIGSGTSFATPAVVGSIDLLNQLYKEFHMNAADLLASTLKAVVIETADSCTTNGGPSYQFGWGVMNTRSAATLIQLDATNRAKNQIKEVLLPNGQSIQFPIISAGTNALKVTICWTDPAGQPNSITNLNNPAIKLVNDVDLRVYSPNGTTNFPWILNPDLTNRTAAARLAVATRGDDNRNNVEQVLIANPTNGTYLVKVTHKGTLQNNAPQWASVAISGNLTQVPQSLSINQIVQTGTNQIAVGWPAVVGGQYQLQSNISLGTTNWVDVGGIISARLTNVITQVTLVKTNQAQFFRVLQVN